MGCDFEVEIQVLYGSTWIPIVFFQTSTMCSGFPLCKAVFWVQKDQGVDGNHGRDQSIIRSSTKDRIAAMRFNVSNSNHKSIPPPAKRAKFVEPASKPKEEASTDAEYTLSRKFNNCASVYYSPQDFVRYISAVRTCEQLKELEQLSRPGSFPYPKGYYILLEPVVKWCKMALTAGPSCTLGEDDEHYKHFYDNSNIWMSCRKEDIDDTTNDIIKAQSALCALHTRFMSQFKPKFRLPGHLTHAHTRAHAHILHTYTLQNHPRGKSV